MQKNRSPIPRLPFEESGPTATTAAENIHPEGCSYKHQKHDCRTKERIDGDVDH